MIPRFLLQGGALRLVQSWAGGHCVQGACGTSSVMLEHRREVVSWNLSLAEYARGQGPSRRMGS